MSLTKPMKVTRRAPPGPAPQDVKSVPTIVDTLDYGASWRTPRSFPALNTDMPLTYQNFRGELYAVMVARDNKISIMKEKDGSFWPVGKGPSAEHPGARVWGKASAFAYDDSFITGGWGMDGKVYLFRATDLADSKTYKYLVNPSSSFVSKVTPSICSMEGLVFCMGVNDEEEVWWWETDSFGTVTKDPADVDHRSSIGYTQYAVTFTPFRNAVYAFITGETAGTDKVIWYTYWTKDAPNWKAWAKATTALVASSGPTAFAGSDDKLYVTWKGDGGLVTYMTFDGTTFTKPVALAGCVTTGTVTGTAWNGRIILSYNAPV